MSVLQSEAESTLSTGFAKQSRACSSRCVLAWSSDPPGESEKVMKSENKMAVLIKKNDAVDADSSRKKALHKGKRWDVLKLDFQDMEQAPKPTTTKQIPRSGWHMHSPSLINLLLGYKWWTCSGVNLRHGWCCANLLSSLTFMLLLLNIGHPALSRAKTEEVGPFSAL